MIFREVEDRDLIAKARQGDVEAYNLLVSRWEKRIFNYLLRLVSNREDALDISQETFLKAYQNLRETRRSGALLGVAVPDRAQRSVFVAAAAQAGERTFRAASAGFRRAACCRSSCRWRSRARSRC